MSATKIANSTALKGSSKGWLPNSELCTGERLSCIGTRVKVWTRWSSKKLIRTFVISSLNTKTRKMRPTKRVAQKRTKATLTNRQILKEAVLTRTSRTTKRNLECVCKKRFSCMQLKQTLNFSYMNFSSF